MRYRATPKHEELTQLPDLSANDFMNQESGVCHSVGVVVAAGLH